MDLGFPGVRERPTETFDDGDGGGAAAAKKKDKKKKKKKKSGGFQSLGLSKPVFSSIMRIGYRMPTPVQRKTLPPALGGADVVVMARTGSGKTAAFLIPLIERLGCKHSVRIGVRGVIVSPTRELAMQVRRTRPIAARVPAASVGSSTVSLLLLLHAVCGAVGRSLLASAFPHARRS